MGKFLKVLKYLFCSPLHFVDSCTIRLNPYLPAKLYLSIRYRCNVGKWINWKTPKTFTEKIQWLKVYGFKPEYTKMVDKYAVKSFVASRIGNEYIIPTLGVWDMVENIEWDSLPDRYVLKITDEGGSNGVFICSNPLTFDKQKVICRMSQIMNKPKAKIDLHRELPYIGIQRKIIAEEFLKASDNSELSDYKFFCFNGEPQFCQVIRDRRTKETIDFYDMKWNHMPFVGLNSLLNPFVKNGLTAVEKPHALDVMIDICRKLSKDIPFVRIDLYYVDNKVYFGEITFYPASGLGSFCPPEWDDKLGSMLEL